MNVPQDDLNLWRRFCDTLRGSMRQALKDVDAGNVQHARRLIEQTEDAGRRLALRMEKAGADRPDAPPPSLDGGTPLHLLDTPANRRYADTLRAAWEAGMAVDRERFGEEIGADGRAQMVEMLLADVEEEIHGAVGMVRE